MNVFYQLFISTTRDAFIMDAKSLSAAQEEARNILAGFCEGMPTRQRINTVRASRIETHHTANSNPGELHGKTLKATNQVTR